MAKAKIKTLLGTGLPVDSMRVRLLRKWQPGFAPGFNGKEDAAVQHHSAMSAG